MRKILLGLCLGLCACGGSGGGDDSPEGGTFAGTWVANFTPTKNDCNLPLASGYGDEVPFLVNQDGQNIAVQNITNGLSLTGAANSAGTGFVVAATVAVACANGATGQERITASFEEVRDGAAIFISEDQISCPGVVCTVVGAGSAERR